MILQNSVSSTSILIVTSPQMSFSIDFYQDSKRQHVNDVKSNSLHSLRWNSRVHVMCWFHKILERGHYIFLLPLPPVVIAILETASWRVSFEFSTHISAVGLLYQLSTSNSTNCSLSVIMIIYDFMHYLFYNCIFLNVQFTQSWTLDTLLVHLNSRPISQILHSICMISLPWTPSDFGLAGCEMLQV